MASEPAEGSAADPTIVAPDLARVADMLAASGGRLGRRLIVRDETESTNDDAKRGAKEGAEHGTVWVAESQTRGRGRQGRAWLSPRGENLLFSALLRVECAPARVPPLSLVCGLAVRDAVARSLGDDANVIVKWPNDVLVVRPSDGRARKVAGILVESVIVGAKVEQIVVGIGINVHTRALPVDVAEIATSIALERDARSATNGPVPAEPLERAQVLTDVLAGLERDVELVAHRGLAHVHARLSKFDAFAGREVETDDGEIRGIACGIDPDGRLLVRRADGVVARIGSGEVRVRAL